jgi:hypothetical protein
MANSSLGNLGNLLAGNSVTGLGSGVAGYFTNPLGDLDQLGSWLTNATEEGPSQVSAPGGGGNLAGDTYEGQFGNLVSNVPVLGGAAGNLLSGLFGSKPSVPNPTSTANSAILGDISNLGNEGTLAQGTTEINASDAALPYEMNLPGYEGNLQQASTNTSQELSGQLPQDVQNLISTQAAERGVATGQGANSPNTNASLLQDLGLTSLQEQQTGQNNLNSLIGETPTGQSFNTQSDQVTPEQEQAAQLLSNEIAAAPDPVLSGLMSMFGLGGGSGGGGSGGGGGIGAIAGLL